MREIEEGKEEGQRQGYQLSAMLWSVYKKNWGGGGTKTTCL